MTPAPNTRRDLATVVLLLLALAILPAPALAERAEWPTWGNQRISDCTFAAAADWELAALGHEPSEAQIIREFHEAGGSDNNGITGARFNRWWARHGIAGIRAHVREVHHQDLWTHPPLPQARHKLGILLGRARYLLATLIWGFGHEVLVIGAGAHGVRFVSYGQVETLSWREWFASVAGLYVVSPIAPPTV